MTDDQVWTYTDDGEGSRRRHMNLPGGAMLSQPVPDGEGPFVVTLAEMATHDLMVATSLMGPGRLQ